jgi:hypothetical protein
MAAAPHVYVDSDVPARMKLAEWRRTRILSRPRPRRRLRRAGLRSATRR